MLANAGSDLGLRPGVFSCKPGSQFAPREQGEAGGWVSSRSVISGRVEISRQWCKDWEAQMWLGMFLWGEAADETWGCSCEWSGLKSKAMVAA